MKATRLRPAAMLALLLAVLLRAGVCSAQEEPEQAAKPAHGDVVLQLLHEKGLVQQVKRVGHATGEMVLSAMAYLGVPYRRGGMSADEGFDCSGFTRHVFENTIGLLLPRRADEQARLAELAPVGRDELKPGDLVFFNTMRRAFSHVGIYIGEGRFIHAPRSGGEVRIESMRTAYWSQRFNGARRAGLTSTGASASAGTPDSMDPAQP